MHSGIEHHLADGIVAIRLLGSAAQGGLKPRSDIGLLVTAAALADGCHHGYNGGVPAPGLGSMT